MAGHEMFRNATVQFTDEYANSLPQKLTCAKYTDFAKTAFQLILVETEIGGFTATGSIKNLARFIDCFPSYVTEQEKSAAEAALSSGKMVNNEQQECITLCVHCPLCDFNTKNLVEYRNHIRMEKTKVTEHEDLRFSCHHCLKKRFETKSMNCYIRHVRTVHGKRKTVLCELCGLSFKRKDILLSHKNTIHGSGPQRPYKCSQCDKSFRCQAHLTTHLIVHSGIKGYSCNYCEALFKTEAARNKHISYMHTNRKAFKCDHCSRTFGTKQHLRNHLGVHEKKKVLEDERRNKLLHEEITRRIQEQISKDKAVNENDPEVTVGGENEPNTPVSSAQHISTTRSAAIPTAQSAVQYTTPVTSSMALSSAPPSAPISSVPSPATPAQIHRVGSDLSQHAALLDVQCSSTPMYPPSTHSDSQFPVSYSERQQSHDNNADLDEIFPESAEEVDDENFHTEFVRQSHQQELDSVFDQNICTDSHLSKPASPCPVTQHTEYQDFPNSRSHAGESVDSILPVTFRQSLSNETSAVPSPQSVCSSQFNQPSRPPSGGSQHNSYAECVVPTLPGYLPQYNIAPPAMAFTQPVSVPNTIVEDDMLASLYKTSQAASTQSMPFVTDTSLVNNKLGNIPEFASVQPPSSFAAVAGVHESCYVDQYVSVSAPHHTNTCIDSARVTMPCVPIMNPVDRCVTPLNYTGAHTHGYTQASASSVSVSDFNSRGLVSTDTLLLPVSSSNEIAVELHTPNKHYPDTDSVISEFPNILSYPTTDHAPL